MGIGIICAKQQHSLLSSWSFFAGIGEQAGSGTDEQQGGGEVIDNPQAADNPDGYLAEDDGAGAEAMPEQETEAPKAEV